MKITYINSNYYHRYNPPINTKQNIRFSEYHKNSIQIQPKSNISFNGINPIEKLTDFIQYKKAQDFSDKLYKYIKTNVGEENFVFRNLDTTKLEGIQYNIKIFKNLTIKEIQYLCENLHVIAVKRGCNHMCGHCYAEAKPSNTKMSYEDFHSIMDGFKTLRKRMHNLDIFGKNQLFGKSEAIYGTTELFFDADCMDIILKDKTGKQYDFIDLSKELYDSLGRKSVFDTCGWYSKNKEAQKRAEKYANYFSKPENMENLENFNISFNVFNQTYIASINALKNGDKEKAMRLKNRFLDDMANTIFTFTPLAKNPRFQIMTRAFHPDTQNAKYYTATDLYKLTQEVLKKLEIMYQKDFAGEQKVIKNKEDINKYLKIIEHEMSSIDTALNPTGRMKDFVAKNNIKSDKFQNTDMINNKLKDMYKDNPRTALPIMFKLIDTDGKIYNMNYACMFKTELQLNLDDKLIQTPKLAGLVDDFIITRENINK